MLNEPSNKAYREIERHGGNQKYIDSTAKDNLVSVAVKEVVKIKNEVSQLNNPIDVAHVGPQAD